MNNKIIKLAVAGALAVAASASSAAVFTFSTAPLGVVPANTFNADQIVFSSLGPSSLTITDTNNDGLLGCGVGCNASADTGVETGLVQFVNFRLGGGSVLPGISGIDINYQMFAVYDGINGGPLTADTTVNGAGDVVSIFKNPTGARVYLDSGALNNNFDLGTSTLIATLTLDPTQISNCTNPSFGAAQGTCVVNFDMTAPTAGVWNVGGTDVATAGGKARIDLNVDQLSPPLQLNYGAVGGTQTTSIDHDGSARISVVPEPTSLALLALGLISVTRVRRKS